MNAIQEKIARGTLSYNEACDMYGNYSTYQDGMSNDNGSFTRTFIWLDSENNELCRVHEEMGVA